MGAAMLGAIVLGAAVGQLGGYSRWGLLSLSRNISNCSFENY